jgi:hypothetical protein
MFFVSLKLKICFFMQVTPSLPINQSIRKYLHKVYYVIITIIFPPILIISPNTDIKTKAGLEFNFKAYKFRDLDF